LNNVTIKQPKYRHLIWPYFSQFWHPKWARSPPVALFNCWRPSFRCGWCSATEQSATWHRREWHTVTFPLWTQNIFI